MCTDQATGCGDFAVQIKLLTKLACEDTEDRDEMLGDAGRDLIGLVKLCVSPSKESPYFEIIWSKSSSLCNKHL